MPSQNPQDLPKSGKLIAFDVGSKTLGIAVSDKSRMISNPRTTLKRTKWGQDKVVLQKLVKEEEIAGAVVGLPLTMGGDYSSSTDAANSFADLFEQEFGIPVILWDERLTTQAATNALFEQRQGRQKRASKKDVKQQVDSVAASLILQGVLDSLKFGHIL